MGFFVLIEANAIREPQYDGTPVCINDRKNIVNSVFEYGLDILVDPRDKKHTDHRFVRINSADFNVNNSKWYKDDWSESDRAQMLESNFEPEIPRR